MIKAVIFDMDGVLVDSEPYWRIAMIKGFRDVGIDFTEEDCRTTTGMRFDEVVKYWYAKKAWTGKSVKDLEEGVIDELCGLITQEAIAMPGVMDSLNYFTNKQFKIGLGTSSCHKLIDSVMDKLQVRPFFQAIESAEHLPFGKPHPQVFLNCAEALSIAPEQCLVIEDSLNGVIAARAARMKVIAVPEAENFYNPGFALAHLKLASLKELNEEVLHQSFF